MQHGAARWRGGHALPSLEPQYSPRGRAAARRRSLPAHPSPRALPAGLLLFLLLFAAGAGHAANGPGQVLRDYLRARLQGDLAAAEKLWDPRDLRRTGALGITFPDVEASYDDSWMLSAAARKSLAERVKPVLRDSVVSAVGTRFSVVLEPRGSGARDTLSYLVQQVDGEWRVTPPYLEASREWTRRESRFLRLRAKKLVQVSQHALTAVDDDIAGLLAQLGAPPAAVLRLERIKLEYYLGENDDDLRALVGAVGHAGYRPSGGRVVAREMPDMAAIARLVVHLTLRNAPLQNEPMFVDGLAAALGGNSELNAAVYLQRARDLCRREPARLETPFGAAVTPAEALPTEAVWDRVLLDELGGAKFQELLRATAGKAPEAGPRNAAARRAIEKALGQSGPALLQRVQQRLATYPPTIRPGCEKWPTEIPGLQPILRWRGSGEDWGLLAYEVGADYIFTMAPYDAALPKWMRHVVDSLSTAYAGEKATVEVAEVKRPSGDPVPIAMLVRAKLEEDLEPYESTLFTKHFLNRDYKNDLFGLFITPDDVRLYDYTRNKLIAEYVVKMAAPGGPVYYDEKPGHICFNLDKKFAPRSLTSYYVFINQHTGE